MRRLLIATFALCLLLPATVSAAGYQQMYRDCQDGHIDGHYSQSDYQKALAHLPADLDEYTNCRDVIRAAQLAAAGGGKTGGGSSGSGSGGGAVTGSGSGPSSGSGTSVTGTTAADPLASATPAERKALAAAGKAAQPVHIAGSPVTPGSLGLHNLSSSGSAMPTSLVVLLVLLGLAALGYAGSVIWSRVHAGRLR
jgi:hypothetical protein